MKITDLVSSRPAGLQTSFLGGDSLLRRVFFLQLFKRYALLYTLYGSNDDNTAGTGRTKDP